MSVIVLRSVFDDGEALRTLLAGRGMGPDDLHRRALVNERPRDPVRPDHFYRAYRDERMPEVGRQPTWGGAIGGHYAKVVEHVLDTLAQRFVEHRRGRLAINPDQFEGWQHLLPLMSPLAVAVRRLWQLEREHGLKADWSTRLQRLQHLLGPTALMGAAPPAIDDLERREGLRERHLHLNGTAEADRVWPHFIAEPRIFTENLKNEGSTELVHEQLEALEPGLTPESVFRRIRAGRRVRHIMTAALAGREPCAERPPSGAELFNAMRAHTADGDLGMVQGMPLARHPVWRMRLPNSVLARLKSDLSVAEGRDRFVGIDPFFAEAVWLWGCYDALDGERQGLREVIGLGLYFNFLLYTQISRLSVQAPDAYSFDQFQMRTLNGVRDEVEKTYKERFFQMDAHPRNVLTHIEGRFAPKDDHDKQTALLRSILKGFAEYAGCPKTNTRNRRIETEQPTARHFDPFANRQTLPACITGETGEPCPRCGKNPRTRHPALALTAHFIKMADTSTTKLDKKPNSARLRFQGLRHDLNARARTLVGVLDRHPLARHVVTGIDGAAHELDAPPAVFAPAFRLLKRAGINHVTFHAGEEFRHLVQGLRTIHEVMEFLPVRDGDRLGHAVAAGIDPAHWLRTLEDPHGRRACVLMPCDEALDDAVLAHALLVKRGDHGADVARLEQRISAWSAYVYGEPKPPTLLVDAWKLRRLDLHLAYHPKFRDLIEHHFADASFSERVRRTTLDEATRRELHAIAQAKRDNRPAFEVLCQRQDRAVRKRGAERVEVGLDDYSQNVLWALQQETLKKVVDKRLVIETLPTSNVRIAPYDGFPDHHLFRWLGLKTACGTHDEVNPTVVVGSDDPGIFATNMHNEFVHIHRVLTEHYGLDDGYAADILDRLNTNARRYSFSEPVSLHGVRTEFETLRIS